MKKGVLDNGGNRPAPQFDHHSDDNFYADVDEHMNTTVCSSVLALWLTLGFPHDDTPDPDPSVGKIFARHIPTCRRHWGTMLTRGK